MNKNRKETKTNEHKYLAQTEALGEKRKKEINFQKGCKKKL